MNFVKESWNKTCCLSASNIYPLGANDVRPYIINRFTIRCNYITKRGDSRARRISSLL